MLNSVTLKNFRRHTDLSVTFGAGMTAIRALNEQGKTTLLEAVAYAMFGVKAIRDSLEDVVTWGEHVNSLKVDLQMVVDGVVYDIKRSKSGAEVNYDGGIVTGQNEVSAFVARLLKVDAAAAARLTLSNQNEIRGALEAGTKATTELIEKLAEFDQIDKLIDLIQEKLTLGATAVTEAAIANARAALERAESQVQPVDTEASASQISLAESVLRAADTEAGLAQKAEDDAAEEHSAVRNRIVHRDNVARKFSEAGKRVTEVEAKLKTQRDVPKTANVAAQVTALKQQIVEAGQSAQIAAAFSRVKPFTAARDADTVTYEGTPEALLMEIESAVAKKSDWILAVAKLNGEVKLLESQLTYGTCGFCGQDFSSVPEVAEKNQVTSAKLAALVHEQHGLSMALDDLTEELTAMRGIQEACKAVIKAMQEFGQYVTALDLDLPPVLVWTGPEVGGTPANVKALQQQIDTLEASERAYTLAQDRAAQLLLQRVEEAEAADSLQAELGALPTESITDAQEALDTARATNRKAREANSDAKVALANAKRDASERVAAHERAVAAVEDQKAALASREQELETLVFNNALLKRVRTARPIIADKLWNIVLSAVSSYFSEIRGVQSRVTKEKDGFKVDEHPTSSLSGSTLDALGLAIRVALVRTFLPSAPFLILDEPAAAMDSNRTDNMLGFLSTCGFQQILLVTHEEVSEAIADHLVTL